MRNPGPPTSLHKPLHCPVRGTHSVFSCFTCYVTLIQRISGKVSNVFRRVEQKGKRKGEREEKKNPQWNKTCSICSHSLDGSQVLHRTFSVASRKMLFYAERVCLHCHRNHFLQDLLWQKMVCTAARVRRHSAPSLWTPLVMVQTASL